MVKNILLLDFLKTFFLSKFSVLKCNFQFAEEEDSQNSFMQSGNAMIIFFKNVYFWLGSLQLLQFVQRV